MEPSIISTRGSAKKKRPLSDFNASSEFPGETVEDREEIEIVVTSYRRRLQKDKQVERARTRKVFSEVDCGCGAHPDGSSPPIVCFGHTTNQCYKMLRQSTRCFILRHTCVECTRDFNRESYCSLVVEDFLTNPQVLLSEDGCCTNLDCGQHVGKHPRRDSYAGVA